MLRRENTEGLESERPLPCMGVTAPIRAHNVLYGPCRFYARKAMLQVFYFCKFFERPSRDQPRKPEGRGTRALFRLLAFGASSCGQLARCPAWEKVSFLRWAPLHLQTAAKDESPFWTRLRVPPREK